MSLIQWNDSFSVGVQEIDDQHKQLLAILNELSSKMAKGKSNDEFNDILLCLFEYARVHFKAEEEYINKNHKAISIEHKQEHETFLNKVLDLKLEFDNGNTKLSLNLMKFLCTWLQSHIKGTDKAQIG